MKWKNQLITQFKLGYTYVKIARLIADKIWYFFVNCVKWDVIEYNIILLVKNVREGEANCSFLSLQVK